MQCRPKNTTLLLSLLSFSIYVSFIHLYIDLVLLRQGPEDFYSEHCSSHVDIRRTYTTLHHLVSHPPSQARHSRGAAQTRKTQLHEQGLLEVWFSIREKKNARIILCKV